MSLENIKIGHSKLSDEIFLYRHGKNQNVALDKRPAHRDVMTAVIEYLTHNAPEGSQQDITIGRKTYTVSVVLKQSGS